MSYKDFDKNEPTDDIDWLFQATDRDLPPPGRAFETTLAALRAEAQPATVTPLPKQPKPRPLPRIAFGLGGMAAALTIAVTGAILAVVLLSGLWLTSPSAPGYTLSAELNASSAAPQTGGLTESKSVTKQGVLSDGSRAFPQYLDYTQLRRENKTSGASSSDLNVSSSFVPQLDRFGDNTAPKNIPINYGRQMG